MCTSETDQNLSFPTADVTIVVVRVITCDTICSRLYRIELYILFVHADDRLFFDHFDEIWVNIDLNYKLIL